MTDLMMRIVAPLLVLTLIAGCGGSSGSSTAHDNGPDAAPPPAAGTVGDGTLTDLAEWARQSERVPALGVVLVGAGQILELAAAGKRSADATAPVTVDDRWHIGSLTKSMTATLAGVLIDQSLIEWTTTPLDVWPELDAVMHPGFRDVTLRSLLAHTSGMKRADVAPERYHDAAPGSAMEKRRAWAAELLAEAPASTAGREAYSNGGFVVAAAMLETRTGTPWETLLAQQVFAPLAMNGSGYGAPGTAGLLDQPLGHWDGGTGFDAVPPGPDADNPAVLGPAGTVHATLGDYGRFMLAHLAAAQGLPGIATANTFEALRTPVADGSAPAWGVSDAEPWANGPVLGYAGSNLRWYAVVRIAPGLDGGALIVVNAGGVGAERAIDRLSDLVLERFRASQPE